ncbi:MAG TPA: ferritin family protein [Geobacteraceae bacterium]
MPLDNLSVQEAVRRSIQTEKNAMDFYRLGALEMKDPDARRIFEALARDEREHAASFFAVYTGTDIPSLEQFLEKAPEHQSEWLTALQRLIGPDFKEQQALELAMEKEQKLEASLHAMAARISEATVRAVFEKNAHDTHNHYLTIEAEYARLMAMVDESDMDIYVRE